MGWRSLLVVVVGAGMASWLWRDHLAQQDAQALRQLARPGDIRMISSESCGWCLAARRWMNAQGIPFDECFVEQEARCLADYEALGAAGTPTLVVRGQRVVGFDRGQIEAILRQP